MSTDSDGGTPSPLDQLEEEMRGRRGPEQAITSAELADRLELTDGAAQPRTRKLLRELISERMMPLASGPQGYYLLDSSERLWDYLDGLDGRIAGIEERKTLVLSAWRSSGLVDDVQPPEDVGDCKVCSRRARLDAGLCPVCAETGPSAANPGTDG